MQVGFLIKKAEAKLENSEKNSCINTASNYSKKILMDMRNDLKVALAESKFSDKITIVATGSYGRNEASASSDLDLFIFFDSDKPHDTLDEDCQKVKTIIEKYITKQPGDTGTFGHDAIVKFDGMLSNIGGEGDSNKNLTRRMLFLLEGTWLYGEGRYADYRKELINKYLNAADPQNQIPRFLLNDIIRYYRTITTDFQHKVAEENKSWGLRNVKLRFSRKLLYFGGLIAVAELTYIRSESRADKLSNILDEPVLSRIQSIGSNNTQTEKVLSLYNGFLEVLEDPKKREELEKVNRNERDNSDIFSDMKKNGKLLSLALQEWLNVQYSPQTEHEKHPIHNALIF